MSAALLRLPPGLGNAQRTAGLAILNAQLGLRPRRVQGGQINKDKAATAMTADQIAEAQRMARDWMAKHQ